MTEDVMMEETVAPEQYDPANDVPRLLIKVGALSMRLEEAASMIDVLRNALMEKEREIAELQATQPVRKNGKKASA